MASTIRTQGSSLALAIALQLKKAVDVAAGGADYQPR
jgi:hypothetical protein